MLTFSSTIDFKEDVNLVLLTEDKFVDKDLTILGLDELISNLRKYKGFTAQKGQSFSFIHKERIIKFVGLGHSKDLNLTSLRVQVRKAILSEEVKNANSVSVLPQSKNEEVLKSIIEAILIGAYAWDKYKTKKSEKNEILNKDFIIFSEETKSLLDVINICEGVNLTRDLVNDNADSITSEVFENVVQEIIKGKDKVNVRILNKKEMEKEGLGLHLAVNQGSVKEPKLIIVEYKGGKDQDPYVALVGKGLTFDTGGLNLKSTGNIEDMRIDMAGAAAVVGVLQNTVSLNLEKNILFVLGIAENVTGSRSYKPGDVLKSYSGKTVEVRNTDAEGRLVLADAISFVMKNYEVKSLIDIATLTGACVVALGFDYAGFVSTSDNLARALEKSSQETDDRIWRLPTYPEIKDSLKSEIADIANLADPKGVGGMITAAEFLRQFTDDGVWAHIDIAGSSFVNTNERMYFGYGATGSGVRLLTHFLNNE